MLWVIAFPMVLLYMLGVPVVCFYLLQKERTSVFRVLEIAKNVTLDLSLLLKTLQNQQDEDVARALFAEFDQDGDHSVTLEEFTAAIIQRPRPLDEEEKLFEKQMVFLFLVCTPCCDERKMIK